MTTESAELPLPDFVHWPIFPFVGDMQVRPVEPRREVDGVRDGEPGGGPCQACAATDEECVWVDEHWRVRAPATRPGVPVQLFLETRAHVDMDELDPERAAELGQLIVRIDRAVQAIDGIGRVHVSRWGDGALHFHLWFFGRPRGDVQMLGFCLPMWAMILPGTPDDEWNRNLATVARELAKESGRAIAAV